MVKYKQKIIESLEDIRHSRRLPLILVIIGTAIIGTTMLVFSKADSSYQPVPLKTNIFSPDSFAVQPVDKVTQLNADSSAMVANFINQYKTHYGAVSVASKQYSIPFYVAKPTDPRHDVAFSDCQKKGYLPREFTAAVKQMPIPNGAAPALGTDSSMTIYSPEEDTLWELWKAKQAGDGSWSACWAGKISPVSKSQGIFNWPMGLSASGLSYWALTAKVAELQAGEVNHAIGFALPKGGYYGNFSYPANRSDGRASPGEQHQIYQGQRFRLDPSVDVSKLKISPMGKTLAKAIQKYGLVIIDTSGSVGMSVESSATYTNAGLPDPYKELFAGKASYQQFDGMPWDKLQALPFDYGKPANVKSRAPAGTATVDIAPGGTGRRT